MQTKTLTHREIERMREVDIRAVDPDSLQDIREVTVNTELSKKDRILDFLRQIGNPYCYRHGKYVVKVSFSDTEATLEDRMLSYLRSKC
ncbi:MAG TPA: hypothetical protein H9763_04885 [Candidatus Eisenbergiella merdigallinarum]|uniref:DUF6870 domain-containing protein n=1 Tax=Candidatus Eisenbergiella merdigallinarum TaxID=2838552 RepID=A0A9D2SDM6_9FIRM|nr:hypothetical protein [Candidatus Eisenbergiella merdigallinarum]